MFLNNDTYFLSKHNVVLFYNGHLFHKYYDNRQAKTILSRNPAYKVLNYIHKAYICILELF